MKKSTILFCVLAVAVVACFVIVLKAVIIPNATYNTAISLANDGRIVEAYEKLISLNGYKDSAEKARELHDRYVVERGRTASVGDYIVFGSYEQDDDTSNGKEDIEWLVLERKGNKMLIISRYILDEHSYNNTDTTVTWERCSLRKWLNSAFLVNAFSINEQKMIVTSTVANYSFVKGSYSSEADTIDNVFCLSLEEVARYFSSDEERESRPTRAVGPRVWWWLRTPVQEKYMNRNGAAAVVTDGTITNNSFHRVDDDYGGVRPAMWVDLAP